MLRDALEPRAVRALAEHPVALHAPGARGGDALAQVEPAERSAAEDGAASAARVLAVRPELAEQQRPLVVVLPQQPEQVRHEDERVVVHNRQPGG